MIEAGLVCSTNANIFSCVPCCSEQCSQTRQEATVPRWKADVLREQGLRRSPLVPHRAGWFGFNSSGSWTETSSTGLTPPSWGAPAWTLESWLKCRPLWCGSLALPQNQDLLMFSGHLYSLQTHHPEAILLHPVGASWPECFSVFNPSPELHSFPSKEAPVRVLYPSNH